MENKKLLRSTENKLLMGVCGGIGEYFGIDPTIVRVIAVILGIGSVGTALIIYLIMGFVVPQE